MHSTAELVKSIKWQTGKFGFTVLDKDPRLDMIGIGRSAAVFKLQSKALKVFFPGSTHIAQEEAEIYKMLKGNAYYPTLYESGENYLLIDFIEGNTFFDCLSQGVPLSISAIQETDHALYSARQLGLNPSDIHLRNIILTPEGKVKLIDVARFRQTKDCRQWSDLKRAYFTFYSKSYFPKKIPVSVLNTVAYLYKKKIHQHDFYKKTS